MSLAERPVAGTGTQRISELASRLAESSARLDAAFDQLAAVEVTGDAAVGKLSDDARRLAAAGGVAIPSVSVDEDLADELHPAVLEAEHIVQVRAAEMRRRARSPRTARRREPMVVAALSFVGFAVLGWFAVVRSGVVPGDAISRVQGALAVVAGRDPHPESIGFIWGPFPTLFEAPLALFRHWLPELTERSFAASLVSAAFMAGTVAQLVMWGRECGSPRWSRWLIALLTMASPLIVLYGANGMSEACWLFFLVLAVRSLSRWVINDELGSLMVAGAALGLAYLTRYETAASVLGAVVVVTVVSANRAPALDGWERGTVGGRAGRVARRARSVVLDVAILSFPIAAAVLGWALASWLIVGEPLAQLSSDYGNAALVRSAGGLIVETIGDASVPGRVWFYVRQVLIASPLMVPLLLAVVWLGGRPARRAAVAASIVGTPLLLQMLLSGRAATFPWFRYVICAVALTSLLAMVASGGPAGAGGRTWLRPLAVAMLIPGLLLSWGVAISGDLGATDDRDMIDGLRTAVAGDRVPESQSIIERGRRVAADIGRRDDVVPGAVLTDTSSTFAVVSAAPTPEDYIIPSDRDFEPVAQAPATFGVRYVLLRLPASSGDAVVREHPGLASNQDAAFERVQVWGTDGDAAGQFVLYRVLNPTGEPRPSVDDGFIR